MTTLYQRYRKQIKDSFDWGGIKKDLLKAPQKEWDNDGNALFFLGTCFAIMPSGKYYTPWANSNVEPCPVCKGKGEVQFPAGDAIRHGELIRQLHQIADANKGKTYHNWNGRDIIKYESIEKQIEIVKPTTTCNRCGGLGSWEAYQDQEYQKALENVSNECGLFVTSGEGDPCDIFVGLSMGDRE